MMISVNGQEGCKTFYTTDDSEPTADSVPYTGPIPSYRKSYSLPDR